MKSEDYLLLQTTFSESQIFDIHCFIVVVAVVFLCANHATAVVELRTHFAALALCNLVVRAIESSELLWCEVLHMVLKLTLQETIQALPRPRVGKVKL